MAGFYNPKRNSDWNYGGKSWRLSRSKIDLFISCQRCFYLPAVETKENRQAGVVLFVVGNKIIN